MVQLLIRLAPPRAAVDDILYALRAVMHGAQNARGCRFAQICQTADETRRIEFVEERDDERELRAQFGSERLVRLFTLLETAVERPVMEFRVIAETHGLEYIVAAGSAWSLVSGD